MKYNIFLKLFTFVFVFILFAIPVFAENMEVNILSQVEIDQTENNSYRLSLFFNEKYTGNAFIQKRQNGSYFVFIPDTVINNKNTKIIYNNKKDEANIKINIEENPYIKDSYESSYIKISVDILNNYSLKLVSKTIHDKNIAATPFISLNLFSLILIIMAAIAIFMISRVIKSTKNNKEFKSYTAFPRGYSDTPKMYDETPQSVEQNVQKPVLPKVNIKNTLKSSNNDSFSCFEIPYADNPEQTAYEFKSTLKQTSVIQKEKMAKSRQSNPLKNVSQDDDSEFSLPVVEDIIKPAVKEEKTNPELLSELRITPSKGFYLTTADDNFALFGFVNEKLFLLKKFNDLSQINLQARFYDRQNGNDLYIVRLDSYKAMIEISENGMKELAVL